MELGPSSLGKNLMIQLSKSCLTDLEKKAVLDVLDRNYLGMGQDVLNFEQQLGEFFGRPAVCVVNGTAALQLALQSCGVGLGDEVIVPSLNYVASFQAISACGAKPVACDVIPTTLTFDPEDASKRITNKTKAIMPMHYAGGVGQLEEVYKFAESNRLRVIEDAAHAFGSEYKNKKVGSFGDIVCFSFDGIKNITSGEGGCVVSNDSDLIEYIRDARLLGVHKDSDMRYCGRRSWNFDVSHQGWRYHMSNIMAAIGSQQLYRFEELAKIRKSHAKLYDKLLQNIPSIKIISQDYESIVPHIYAIRIPGLKNREELQLKMMNFGIQTGFHYQLNHKLSFYRDLEALPLPVSESLESELLTLPLHPDLIEDEIEFVVNKLVDLV